MDYLLGVGIAAAYLAVRYFTLRWVPTGGRRAESAVVREPGLYAARSLVSLVLLAAAFAFLLFRASHTSLLFPPVSGVAAILPSVVGVVFSLLALMQVSQAKRLPEFLGLSTGRKVLFVNGMFALCRHPMYAGVLLALWGLLLSEPYALTVFVVALLSLSFILEASHEEQTMVRDFGAYYSRYQATVPFLVPFGFLRSRQVADANGGQSATAPASPGGKRKQSARRGRR
ncbi:MAG: DUF1295 domain-containing protein [Chloroflexi bacterium]|nr:DUF1295 domain-containing protein [Chloroflexota bacterium]MCL5107268.1 DUF1295 domain-containing protein [Chloroflexota bacterium]MDA8216205.1 methyltransferase [Dehalococcoidales bacterium]